MCRCEHVKYILLAPQSASLSVPVVERLSVTLQGSGGIAGLSRSIRPLTISGQGRQLG